MKWTTAEGGGYYSRHDDHAYLIEHSGWAWTLTVYYHSPSGGSFTELTQPVSTLRDGKRTADGYRKMLARRTA